MKLLVATQNSGKMREFRLLLASLQAALVFPHEIGLQIEVPEDGVTYADNAAQKVRAYLRASGLPTLADDSGLEVDALGGAPGLHSARYTLGRDVDRTAALLTRLHDVPSGQRTARFRCVVVIETPDGERYRTEGVCEGVIASELAGQGGFGYDPIFYLPEYDCTMAQLSEAIKNRISHRARAVQAALPTIRRLLREDESTILMLQPG